MAEYRLDDLARISGVSPRNIRAYRERGLLDPPRRQGRTAYYDDYHLSQLNTITQLLRKGYTSAHIAEFFARMREGHDLAAILGIQQAILGRPAPDAPGEPRAAVLKVDADSDEVRRLVSYGLAEVVDDTVTLTDPAMYEIVARSTDHLRDVRMILRVFESAAGSVDELAAMLVAALEEAVAARYGPDYVPTEGETDELARLIGDYRDLGVAVVTHQLEKSMHQHMASGRLRDVDPT